VNEMRLSHLRTIGIAAIVAFPYEAIAQNKKPAPPEKWAACSSLKSEGACNAGKNCNWVVERKDEKGTVKRKTYCRSNPNTPSDAGKK